jgi:type IV pilus assembly protein PilA
MGHRLLRISPLLRHGLEWIEQATLHLGRLSVAIQELISLSEFGTPVTKFGHSGDVVHSSVIILADRIVTKVQKDWTDGMRDQGSTVRGTASALGWLRILQLWWPMGLLKKQTGFTLIELMIVVAILGIVAALAIPNFLRYQVQTRQSEVRTNLGAIYVSETSYYGERSTFGTFDQIGFTLAGRTNRYAYRIGPGGTASVDLLPPMIGSDPGQNTIVPSDLRTVPVPGFTAAATANLDVDPVVDMWHVNDLKEGLQNADQNDVRWSIGLAPTDCLA